MKILKDKKSEGASTEMLKHIVSWAILILLIIVVAVWSSGYGTKIIEVANAWFNVV